MTKISKYEQFEFFSALGNFFTFVSTHDDNLKIVVDVYELSDIDFDNYMSFGDLLEYDEIDIYYDGDLITWEAV
jgi:hypothetical protein